MCHPLSREVKVKNLFVISKKRKKNITSADSFSIKLPGSSMLQLAVKQSPSQGSVSLKLLGSQRSQIPLARRQLPLSVLMESGSALTDRMRVQNHGMPIEKSIFTKGF